MIPAVGQIMWLAYSEPRNQGLEHAVIVTKVGRKWATIYRASVAPGERRPWMKQRFNIEDPRWFVSEGGYSMNSRVFPSREMWEKESVRDAAFNALRRVIHVGRYPGPDVTAGNVRRAAIELGLGADFERELTR